MTLKNYLILMLAATVLCWGAFIMVADTVNPFTTNFLGLALFYVSLFLALTGTFAIAGFLVRFAILKQALAFRLVTNAFRQSFLLALLVIASMILQSFRIFSWLNFFLLAGGTAGLEYFLIANSRPKFIKPQ